MAKAYIFLADGFEEIEGLTVVDILRRANIEIIMVSVTGDIFVCGSHRIMVKADTLFENTDFSNADMLILPGGMPGTKALAAHQGLDRLLREFHAKGGKISAICAAPSVLGSKGLLKGKKAICYPGYENALSGATIQNDGVVADGNIITSKGMGTAIDFALAIVKSFAGEAEAHKVAKGIQYPYYQ